MAVDDTPAGATANSYIDETDAQSYFDTRLNTDAWDDALPTDQEKALLQACQMLDMQDYIGVETTDTQALKWPRLDEDEVTLIRNYGGTQQVETATIVGTVTGDGDASVTVTADGLTGSPIVLAVAVLNTDTASVVAGKIRVALGANADIVAFATVGGTGADVSLTKILEEDNDATFNIAYDNGTCTGLTPDTTSTNTVEGALYAVPEPVRKAQCEVALWLLETGGSGVPVSAGTVSSVAIGSAVKVTYAEPTTGTTTTSATDTVDSTGLPITAARFLKGLRLYPYLA